MSEIENSGFTASGGAASITSSNLTTNTTTAAAGIYALIGIDGSMSVSTPGTTVFTDSFDGGVVDTTTLWTTQVGGAGTVSQASGQLTIDSGTTALGYGAIFSKQSFAPHNSSFDAVGFTLAIEASPKTNLTRFWGKATVPGTPTVAVPVTDGFGFQLDNASTFRAIVYAAGAVVFSQAITAPADASKHVYVAIYRGDTILWYQDTFTLPIASTNVQPGVQASPIAMVAVAAASGPSAGQATTVGLLSLSDLGKNTNQIADGLYPWRLATVKGASTAAAATDLPLVVALHPSTPVIPGTAATNLGKAEDAVAASGDTGIFALAIRRDTLTTSASATGDYNEIAVDQYGAVLMRNYEKQARTYSASTNVAAAASATDIAAVFGNGTTTVLVTKVIVSGIQTTGGLTDVQLVKRSTANSGGTSANMTVVPHDANDAAANSTPLSYTANPTTGTPIGSIRRAYAPIGAVTSVVNPVVEFNFGERGRPVVLRGTAQGLCVNLNGATLTGGTFDIDYEWYEL